MENLNPNLLSSLLPLVSFAFVTSGTPGPNNILLTASGIRFGFKRSIPHILGIQFGVATMLSMCAFGIGILLMGNPAINMLIRICGTTYLLYLAWGLRRNIVVETAGADLEARPFTFVQAALFQLVNPKAWVMTMTAGSLFVPELESKLLSVALLCITFTCVGGPSSGSWALIGAMVKKYLADPFWQKVFSGVMILLTVYTAIALWFV